MPFSRRFPFFKCSSSEKVSDRTGALDVTAPGAAPDVMHVSAHSPPPVATGTMNLSNVHLRAKSQQSPTMSTPHRCHGATGPLAGETWKQLIAGKEVQYVCTPDALKAGRDVNRCALCTILLDFIKKKSLAGDAHLAFLLQVLSGGEGDYGAPTNLWPSQTPRLRIQLKGNGRYTEYCLYASAGTRSLDHKVL